MSGGEGGTNERVSTLGELRALLDELPDETKFSVHVGWDWPVEGTDVDEGGFVIFPDVPEGLTFANVAGLEANERQLVEMHRAVRDGQVRIDNLIRVLLEAKDALETAPLTEATQDWWSTLASPVLERVTKALQ